MSCQGTSWHSVLTQPDSTQAAIWFISSTRRSSLCSKKKRKRGLNPWPRSHEATSPPRPALKQDTVKQSVKTFTFKANSAALQGLRSSWDAKEKILALRILHLPSKDAELLLFLSKQFWRQIFSNFFHKSTRFTSFAKVRLKKRRTSNFPGSNYRPKIIRLRSFASKSKILLVVSIYEILNLGLRLKSELTIHLAQTKLHNNLWRQWVKHYSWQD